LTLNQREDVLRNLMKKLAPERASVDIPKKELVRTSADSDRKRKDRSYEVVEHERPHKINNWNQRSSNRYEERDRDKPHRSEDRKQTAEVRKRDSEGCHWSDKPLECMNARDWRILKEDFNISTKGTNVPNPIRNWKESGLPPPLLKAVAASNYQKPTPIQMQAIPTGMQGRDILGVAETGSGKTLAYLLPLLEHISKLPKFNDENKADGPYAVILAPTRELALQIEEEAIKFGDYIGVKCVSAIGGHSIDRQTIKIQDGVEIVIATPFRLIDLLDKRFVVLNQCHYVVLDEADRMIDMNFEPQVVTILDAMPTTNRTTVLFSATMPPAIERLAKKYLQNPVHINVGEPGHAVDTIEQRVQFVKSEHEKMRKLADILHNGPPPPIIIFVNTKVTCNSLTKQLAQLGFTADSLHGGLNQEQREFVMNEFRVGRLDIMVTTNVSARGLDIKGVTHVINYDMPNAIKEYVHRIGRTGRAGEKGLATAFITNDDAEVFYDLKQTLISTNNHVPPELDKHPASKEKNGSLAFSSSHHDRNRGNSNWK
jgi:ATP-dependent RNA helicase DDX23/PRP28